MTSPGAAPAPAAKTNTLAIVALVISIIGCSIVGIILGFVAKSQIQKTGEAGDGIATAAIVVGIVWIVVSLLFSITF